MKRRSTFSSEEITELRRLIREKQTADRSRQKILRNTMRSLGFYISAFTSSTAGFTVSDLDDLIERGIVQVANSPTVGQQPPTLASTQTQPNTGSQQTARDRRARAAQRYKPEKIGLLLVAEAPPEALDRYFYFPAVRTQDSLFRYVCRAILGCVPTRGEKTELLAALRDRGVFLIDLQEDPRDETPLLDYVPDLIERCHKLNPLRIILIKVTVFDAAYHAISDAGLLVSSVRVPFPGSGQQKRFEQEFQRALEEVEFPPAA